MSNAKKNSSARTEKVDDGKTVCYPGKHDRTIPTFRIQQRVRRRIDWVGPPRPGDRRWQDAVRSFYQKIPHVCLAAAVVVFVPGFPRSIRAKKITRHGQEALQNRRQKNTPPCNIVEELCLNDVSHENPLRPGAG